jgi:UPF0716 family protein affecting phage T7 exclusion
MSDSAAEYSAVVSRNLLLGGVMLMGVGGILVMAGGLVTTVVAVQAGRRWVQSWEEPPSVVARRRWGQARSAVSAGAQSWRDGRPSVAPTAGVGR